jgi:glutamate/tyrosine decarboxylase-like PLP-dependent enzyme
LAALTAARNAKLSENQYGDGVAYISGQTHISAAKGLRIIGFRGDQIRKIPCDDNYRMVTSSLEKAILDDQAAGKIPFVVIASAGTTNTGSIDPMNDIATICEKHNLWLHVDGAYGASILVSQKYKYLLDGVSRSNSISWDAHKWLMQTYSCSALLVRDKQCLINGFSANPEYYKDATATDNEINYWEFGPEMTRPARSLKLWITLQVLGTEAMGRMVEYGVQLAEWAEDEIKKHENWEIISPAQLGIINFRYAPPGFTDEQLDALNTKISNAIVKDGFAFVLTTILAGKTVLRMIAIHPDTTEDDIRNTIRLLAKYALEAVAAQSQS